jgi:hypothetical protein
MSAVANRVFEVLGDSVALAMVRDLQRGSQTQAELVRSTGASQSAVSRAASNLRLLGLTAAASPRGKISLRTSTGIDRLLLAANALAEDVLAAEAAEQAALSAGSADWADVAATLKQPGDAS